MWAKFGVYVLAMLFGSTIMLTVDWFKIPVAESLGMIVAVLGTSMTLSLIATSGQKPPIGG